MSGYVRRIKVEVQFDGQLVHLTLKPLLRGDLFKLQGLLPERGIEHAKADDAMGAFDFYADQLLKYVEEHDLVDAAGQLIPLEEWVNNSYFIPLVGQVMAAHMEKATPGNPS